MGCENDYFYLYLSVWKWKVYCLSGLQFTTNYLSLVIVLLTENKFVVTPGKLIKAIFRVCQVIIDSGIVMEDRRIEID